MTGDEIKQHGASSEEESARAREAREALRARTDRAWRGAAVADEHGRLPPKATHEIVGYDGDGRPILKRRRFSIG